VRTARRPGRRRGQRPDEGQALVELVLIIPMLLVVVMAVAELGVIFGKVSSLGYGSREGARTGSALARGEVDLCYDTNLPPGTDPEDPSMVDAVLVAAVQRILDSPDSGIDAADITQIRIFSADSAGEEIGGTVNIWNYRGEEVGPDVDPGPGVEEIAFRPTTIAPAWRPCDRKNYTDVSGPPHSIGVTVTYEHDWVTPLPSLLNDFAGGGLSLSLTQTTVMALNPTA
jgi:hypothetical protein